MKMHNPPNRVRRIFTVACLAALAVVVAGCASVKRYSSELPKNLQVVPETETGSRFTNVYPLMDIHRVDAKCELQFQGRIVLEDGKVDVGVPTDGLLYLEVIFLRERTFSNQSSQVRQATLLKPRPGYSYLSRVKYINGIYALDVQERSRDGSVKKLERAPLSECKALRG
jgi:hypothetical protein